MLKLDFVTEKSSLQTFLKDRLYRSWLAIGLLLALMLVTVAAEAALPRILGWMLDDFTSGVIWDGLAWKAAVAMALYAVATLTFRYYFSVIAASDFNNFRLVLWRQFLNAPSQFGRGFHKIFFAALVQDAAACSGIFSTLLIQTFQIIFHAIFVIALMLSIHGPLTLVFWTIILAAVGLSLRGSEKYQRLVQVHRHKNAAYLQATHQVAAEGRHLLWAGLAQMGKNGIFHKMSSYLSWRQLSATNLVRIELAVKFILFLALAVVVSALILLHSSGLITTGDSLSFVFLAALATSPVSQSTMLWASIKRLRVSFARINRVEHELSQVVPYKKCGAAVSYPFRDSLRANLSLDKEFTDVELQEALEVFELDSELLAMQINLKTNLSAWTQRLSLGQRQRLQLSRLYLHGQRAFSETDMFAIEPLARKSIAKRLSGVADAK